MPKIPTYISQRSIPAGSPNVPISAEAATAVPRAISGLGQDITQLSDVLIDRKQKIQAREDHNKAREASNITKNNINAYKIEAREVQGSESHGLFKRSIERINKLVAEGGQGLTGNASALYNEMMDVPSQSALTTISGLEAVKVKEFESALLNSTIAGNITASIEDSTRLNEIVKDNDDEIDLTYPKTDNSILKAKTKEATIDAVFDSLIIQSPELAEVFINNNEPLIGKTLVNKYRVDIAKGKKEAESAQITAKNLVEAEAKKVKEKEWSDLRQNTYQQIEGDNVDSAALMELRKNVLYSDLPVKGEHNKDWLINKIDSKAKDLNEGTPNTFKEFDPETEAILRRQVDTRPEEIEALGGTDYIWDFVGRGKDGGITSKQAEEFQKTFESDDIKKQLSTPDFKQATAILDLALDRAVFLSDANDDTDLDDAQAIENRTIHSEMYAEVERRYLDPENKKTAVQLANDLLAPYTEKKSNGFWNKFVELFGGGPTVLEQFGITLPTKSPEDVLNNDTDPKKQQAIDILNNAGKLVNEETIKQVMDQL